jgi:hypothetical protein
MYLRFHAGMRAVPIVERAQLVQDQALPPLPRRPAPPQPRRGTMAALREMEIESLPSHIRGPLRAKEVAAWEADHADEIKAYEDAVAEREELIAARQAAKAAPAAPLPLSAPALTDNVPEGAALDVAAKPWKRSRSSPAARSKAHTAA